MQKSQPRGNGVVKVACGKLGRREGKKSFASTEEARGRERKEVMQAFQPHFKTMLDVN